MLKRLKPKSDFSRNVLTLMTGTTIAQAIPIMISPVLTRIYTPSDFGVLALYLSILLIIGVFATGRYELALPLSEDRANANNILALIFSISIVVSFLVFATLLSFPDFFHSITSEKLWIVLLIMPINIILMSIFNGIQYWLNREEDFQNLASNKVVLNILIASAQIGLGFFVFGINGLVIGYIVGYYFTLLYILFRARHQVLEILYSIQYSKMKHNLIKYKDFPLVNTFHSLSDKIQSDGVIFIITYKFSFAVLGLYSMALRAVTTPAGLIGNAVGQVVFSKFSKVYNKTQNIEDEVLSIIKKLFLFSTVPFIALFFLLPSMFEFVFGDEWKEAGVYAQVLLPFIYLNFIVSPVSNVPLIVKKVKSFFIVSLTGNLVSIAAFSIAVYNFNDFIYTLMVFSATRFIYLSYLLLWIVKITQNRNK